jgi:glycosyltransferase involved in cell wall biosynthesis
LITHPAISVVIPTFGRVEPLKYTLRSAAASALAAGVPVDIIVVDDGSEPSIEEQLAEFDAGYPVRFVRQANQGSIVARLTGYRESRGKYVFFLDSDDVIHPDKLRTHLLVMEKTGADVSYSDAAHATLAPDYAVGFGSRATSLAETDDAVTLLTKIQPAPYSPFYLRSYLEKSLEKPLLPIHRIFDPSGDVWLYRSVAMVPGKAIKVAGYLAATGPHEENRFSQCWEKLGVASLGIDEASTEVCPRIPETETLRRTLGEVAFRSWRLLPADVLPEYDRRKLALWRKAPRSRPAELGGTSFRLIARALGWVNAGRLFRRLQRPTYAQCKTLRSKEEFAALVAKLPTPPRAAK